jgi:predicted LPLAT superfamily acyltransferase
MRAYDALRKGNVVGVLADRADGGRQMRVPFLGRPAPLPTAPHTLAARAQAPLIACFGLYEGGNRYRIVFIDLGAPPPPNCRGDELAPCVTRYASLLEHYARNYPMNWFNFYDFWQSMERTA